MASLNEWVFFGQAASEVEEYRPAEEKRVKGAPLNRLWNHYSDPSQQFHAGVWQSEPGCWKVSYSEHEFCQILEGESVIRDEQGNERTVKAGERFVIPAGFVGEWEVIETCKKIYVLFEPAP
ncbi:cupin domain-containing protein [Ferrimonas balearica]|uniref:cupin domain-containing protein n=1 Tax=Ferrimonas balearica TaxID=44012 RepID=UPI001C996B6A|nr:cupin domain-containing protein [Ferrimonas balearica]MBY5992541.1 cupin domain-containing protein [Ferrimonas balearica]